MIGRKPDQRIVFVTGMSGAGKTSTLKALEDLGYEAIDNLPISLLENLKPPSDEEGEAGQEDRQPPWDGEGPLPSPAAGRKRSQKKPQNRSKSGGSGKNRAKSKGSTRASRKAERSAKGAGKGGKGVRPRKR